MAPGDQDPRKPTRPAASSKAKKKAAARAARNNALTAANATAATAPTGILPIQAEPWMENTELGVYVHQRGCIICSNYMDHIEAAARLDCTSLQRAREDATKRDVNKGYNDGYKAGFTSGHATGAADLARATAPPDTKASQDLVSGLSERIRVQKSRIEYLLNTISDMRKVRGQDIADEEEEDGIFDAWLDEDDGPTPSPEDARAAMRELHQQLRERQAPHVADLERQSRALEGAQPAAADTTAGERRAPAPASANTAASASHRSANEPRERDRPPFEAQRRESRAKRDDDIEMGDDERERRRSDKRRARSTERRSRSPRRDGGMPAGSPPSERTTGAAFGGGGMQGWGGFPPPPTQPPHMGHPHPHQMGYAGHYGVPNGPYGGMYGGYYPQWPHMGMGPRGHDQHGEAFEAQHMEEAMRASREDYRRQESTAARSAGGAGPSTGSRRPREPSPGPYRPRESSRTHEYPRSREYSSARDSRRSRERPDSRPRGRSPAPPRPSHPELPQERDHSRPHGPESGREDSRPRGPATDIARGQPSRRGNHAAGTRGSATARPWFPAALPSSPGEIDRLIRLCDERATGEHLISRMLRWLRETQGKKDHELSAAQVHLKTHWHTQPWYHQLRTEQTGITYPKTGGTGRPAPPGPSDGLDAWLRWVPSVPGTKIRGVHRKDDKVDDLTVAGHFYIRTVAPNNTNTFSPREREQILSAFARLFDDPDEAIADIHAARAGTNPEFITPLPLYAGEIPPTRDSVVRYAAEFGIPDPVIRRGLAQWAEEWIAAGPVVEHTGPVTQEPAHSPTPSASRDGSQTPTHLSPPGSPHPEGEDGLRASTPAMDVDPESGSASGAPGRGD